MAKKKKSRSRSTLRQVNAPTQRTPRSVTDVFARAQQAINNGSRVLQRRNQGLDATVQQSDGNQGLVVTAQQGNAPMTRNVSNATTPDRNNTGANMTQEHRAMDLDLSLLLELVTRTPRFGLNAMSQFSPTVF